MRTREELDRQRRSDNFVETLNWLAGTREKTVSCGDNLALIMEKIEPGQLESVSAWITRRLIRSKSLDRFRLFNGRFLVVVDGTDVATFKERHCPQCVDTDPKGGKGVFKHKALVARLVTECGLTLPIAVEFIENPPDGIYDKQDCERKAFNRIVPKIKALFPQMSICLAGDALFVDQGVMRACSENKWIFIFTFKEGKTPRLYKEALEKAGRNGRVLRLEEGDGEPQREIRWTDKLVHEGNSCYAVFMDEWDGEGNKTLWAWITSIKPQRDETILEITKGGRLRWKIENETINTFVNGGYEMRHVYGGDGHAIKNYFQLLQIAHVFNELVARGDMLRKRTATQKKPEGASFRDIFGTVGNFARNLLESLRNSPLRIVSEALGTFGRFQIRFSSA
jgi:hypothetical protein